MLRSHSGSVTYQEWSWVSDHRFLAAGYILAIVIGELATTLLSPMLGLTIQIALLLVLPLHASTVAVRERPFFLALMLMPLLRIISTALVIPRIPQVLQLFLVTVLMAIALLAMIWLLAIRPIQLGLRMPVPAHQFLIALLGAPIGCALWLTLSPAPVVNQPTVAAFLVAAFVLAAMGVMEELIFRGVIQPTAFLIFGRSTLVITSALFAVYHVVYLSVPYLLMVFGISLIFAGLVARTGSITGVSGAHAVANILVYLALPLIMPPPATTFGQLPFSSDSDSRPQPVTARFAGERFAVQVVENGADNTQALSTLGQVDVGTSLSLAPPAETVPVLGSRSEQEDRVLATRLQYTVIRGDTMNSIARRYQISVQSLAAANKLANPALIYPGQVLSIPREPSE